MIDPSGAFDWRDDDLIVVHEQLALAVYANPRGAVVIRQERAWDEDSDTYIVIRPENAQAIAAAILEAAGVKIGDPAEPVPLSNAERQKRHRERKRNGPRNDGGDHSVTAALLSPEASR